jgi:hypothetical protein
VQAVAGVASARREAVAAGPRQDLLATAGGSARARQVLATSDGRALVEAATLAPIETRVALTVGESGAQLDALEETWRAKGLPADRIDPARHALDALLQARAAVPQTTEQQIVEATGTTSALSKLAELQRTNPAGYRALLEAFEREPALVRRAIRATEQRTLRNALSELARRLHPTWIPDEQIYAVGDKIIELNTAHLSEATHLEQLAVRAESVLAMRDVGALHRDAQVVVNRFGDARRARATQWLGGDLRNEAAELARAVDASQALQELAGRGGQTTLRQLWTMYRAGRARATRLTFPDYVELLQRTHQQGLHGEYQFAFWAAKDYIVIKAPDAGVTVGGTDIILIPRGGGPPIWVDQKAVRGIVSDVSALMRNLPQNVVADLVMMQSLVASGYEFPPELLSALPVQREASRRINAITRGMTKAQIESPAVQGRIDTELKALGIRRVVGSFGGQDTQLSVMLARWFELWSGAAD